MVTIDVTAPMFRDIGDLIPMDSDMTIIVGGMEMICITTVIMTVAEVLTGIPQAGAGNLITGKA